MFDKNMTLKMGWANTIVSVAIIAENTEE